MSNNHTPESIVRAREARARHAVLSREADQRTELLRLIQLTALKADHRLVADEYKAPASHKYAFLRIPLQGEKVAWLLMSSATDRNGIQWSLHFLPGKRGGIVMRRVDNLHSVQVIPSRSLGRYILDAKTLTEILGQLRNLARIPRGFAPQRITMTRGERIECWFRGI